MKNIYSNGSNNLFGKMFETGRAYGAKYNLSILIATNSLLLWSEGLILLMRQ